MKIWFATGNVHKKRELEAILKNHEVKIPADAGLVFDPEETGFSFLENSLIKARALYALVNEPVIADDSGLCVDALDGRPGIYSARYGDDLNKKLSDSDRYKLLLDEMGENQNRAARFICCMVLILNKNRFFIVQETLEGAIAKEAGGQGGFGYDPILYIPEKKCTVAELSPEDKNDISHRAKAGKRIAAILAGLNGS